VFARQDQKCAAPLIERIGETPVLSYYAGKLCCTLLNRYTAAEHPWLFAGLLRTSSVCV